MTNIYSLEQIELFSDEKRTIDISKKENSNLIYSLRKNLPIKNLKTSFIEKFPSLVILLISGLLVIYSSLLSTQGMIKYDLKYYSRSPTPFVIIFFLFFCSTNYFILNRVCSQENIYILKNISFPKYIYLAGLLIISLFVIYLSIISFGIV